MINLMTSKAPNVSFKGIMRDFDNIATVDTNNITGFKKVDDFNGGVDVFVKGKKDPVLTMEGDLKSVSKSYLEAVQSGESFFRTRRVYDGNPPLFGKCQNNY